MKGSSKWVRFSKKIEGVNWAITDERAGRTDDISEPKIHNSELMNLYHQVDQLPDNKPLQIASNFYEFKIQDVTPLFALFAILMLG